MIPAGAERPRREDSDGQTVVFWRCSLCGALLLLTHGSQGLNSGWLEIAVCPTSEEPFAYESRL